MPTRTHFFQRSGLALVLVLATRITSAQTDAPPPLTRNGSVVDLKANALGSETIKVDGRLDEAIYSRIAPASGSPREGRGERRMVSRVPSAWLRA